MAKLFFEVDVLDYNVQPSLEFTDNGLKKRKYHMSGSISGHICPVDANGGTD